MTAPVAPSDPAAPRLSRWRAWLILAAGLAIAGLPVGALWAWIAPPVHGVVALTRGGERVQAYLGNEADHFFVAPFLLLGMLGVIAVVAATLAWQWRAHRGPGMVAGLSVGLTASAALAMLLGGAVVRHRYGVIDVDGAPVSPEHRVHYVVEGPPVFFGHTPLQIAATLLLPAATAALVYGLCATWSPHDDLGGYPPEPARRLAPAPTVTVEGGAARHR
ncbi:DUF2567 domain-containing protein [Mycolicibacter senuensis]|uniref:DUF2567 domain-containing protein n=1 Tax=Mycolicibacter senuensis TaxID=386913 RepID=UPI000DCE0268|nr:DUF2567 domain-containing protein [Mycolicibacter senuensis]RAU92114.1 DUF2567 domain-containing protein [Mycolicibacter senuensis]